MTEPILRVSGLSKQFGGLAAVSDVSLELRRGEVHAVIGPNGAGKTTFINMLSGDLAPSAGAIRFEDREIAGLPADRIARLGTTSFRISRCSRIAAWRRRRGFPAPCGSSAPRSIIPPSSRAPPAP